MGSNPRHLAWEANQHRDDLLTDKTGTGTPVSMGDSGLVADFATPAVS